MDKYLEIRDWSLGVIAANEPDLIPHTAVPKAYNTAFRMIGQGQAVLGMRPGLVTLNDVALTSTPVVHRLVPYHYNTGSAFNRYLALFGQDGTLYFKEDDDDISAELEPPANYPYSVGTAFTSGAYPVDATVMNNRLFAVNTNGERRSLLNTSYVPFGLSPIATVAVTAQSGGSSSMPLETYDIAVTSYNSSTGAESSASASTSVTTAGANDRIRVVITPTAAESAQYTHWRIYLRRQSTQAKLYLVTTLEDVGGSAIAGSGTTAIATTTAYIDLTAAQIAALITQAPSTTENNPPSTAIKYLATYGDRLIAASSDTLFWSKLGQPDNFPPENAEPVETGEGSEVKGICVFSDERLLVFTSSATWAVEGNDPQSWVFRPIDTSIGSVGHLSVASFNGGVAWWSNHAGPVFYGGGSIEQVGREKLGVAEVVDGIEPTRLGWIAAGVDPTDQRVLWSVSTLGTTTRNDKLLPFNFAMKAWEATKWDPLDVAALCAGYDEDGNHRLFVGGYEGQVFYFDRDTHVDGVVSGTRTGTFTASASSASTITGTGFYNSNGKLVERKVTVVDSDYRPVGRRTITSNNATTLTLDTAITGLQAGTTYTYYVGGPDFRLYTKWLDMDEPFLRKRFDRVYIQARAEGSPSLLVATHIDFVDADTEPGAEISVAGDQWDVGVWDSAVWAGTPLLKKRLAIFKPSTAMRVTMMHFAPGYDLVIQKVGVLAKVLSDRYYD